MQHVDAVHNMDVVHSVDKVHHGARGHGHHRGRGSSGYCTMEHVEVELIVVMELMMVWDYDCKQLVV